ncbi:MAG: hemolysin III family protein [Gemmatimonadaceae bacterium]
MSHAHNRAQTRAEELANSALHGTGLVLSIAAIPILVLGTVGKNQPAHLIGSIVFGVTMVLLYTTSTIYHALRDGRAKRVFRVLDHTAIYLLIAGTYTPFALGALRGPWGWTLLGVIWCLAVAGIVSKFTIGFRYPRLSTWFYVGMGWIGVVVLQPMIARVPLAGLLWLLAGGLCYTGGVYFYVRDQRVRYGHALWHVCVMAGTACHFVSVLLYSATR